MRLINVHTLDLEKFPDDNTLEYAILSHTWSTNAQDEPTFQEWETRERSSKPGCQKIIKSCERARDDKLEYVWCDTVCIDKENGVELETAINSMFAWYRNSAVCYAYLGDVSSLDEMPQSRWFNRGWTLQELVAPLHVVFIDCSWNNLGTKSTLQPTLTDITGIEEYFLTGGAITLREAPVGMRMSWLANRTTTFVEDMAFCMLGIFEITIPVYYGQGLNAFAKLQQEIVYTFNDDSIFAWTPASGKPDQPPSVRPWVDLLAPSPSAFSQFPRGFQPIRRDGRPHSRFSLNKAGLVFDVDCVPREVPGSDTKHVIALLKDVGRSSDTGKTVMVGISMKSFGSSEGWGRDPDQPGLTHVLVDSNLLETHERLYVPPTNGYASAMNVLQSSEHTAGSQRLGFNESIAPHFHPQELKSSRAVPLGGRGLPGEVMQDAQERSRSSPGAVEREWTWRSLIFIICLLMNDPVGLHIVVLMTTAAFSQPSSSYTCGT